MSGPLSPVVLAAITACVVVAGVGAGILFQPTTDPDPPAAPMGRHVGIDVITPHEPEPAPGDVMDVGDLADGYMRRDYAPPAAIRPLSRVDPEYDQPARVEPRHAEPPRQVDPDPPRRPASVERRERPALWPFGPDQPYRDHAAERREQIARMNEERRRDQERRFEEARMRERFEESRDYSEPRDERFRDAEPSGDREGRERQWYRSDGRPVQGPQAWD